MMPRQASKARQVASLGETPAEARRRMESSGGGSAPTSIVRPPQGQEVKGPLRPEHLAAIEAAEGGFKGGVSDGPVEDFGDAIEPPSPSKAMAMIRQLSQDKLQLTSEREAALALVERYRARFGDLD